MKILHVYKDYYPPVVGGVEKHIAQLCDHFKDKYEVEVLVCNRGPFTRVENIDGVRVTKVGQLGRIQSAPIPPTFPFWLRKIKADIFHFHMPNPTCEFSHLLARPPGAVGVTYHSDIIRQELLLKLYGSSLHKFLSRTDIIMPTSEVYAKQSPLLSDFLEKCEVVPLGVDTRRFDAAGKELKPEIEKLRSIFGPQFIMFVGKLRYYKGLQFLIEALPKVDSPLVVIGNGPMGADLKALASDYGVAEKTHFVGEVSDDELTAFYHACALFVLPSVFRSEAYGLVQLEAHACGKPVISTRLGTGVEFVNELLSDPERRKRMGEFARRRAQSEFDLQLMFDRVEAVYKRALAR